MKPQEFLAFCHSQNLDPLKIYMLWYWQGVSFVVIGDFLMNFLHPICICMCAPIFNSLELFLPNIMHLSKFCPTYPHAGNVGEYEGI